MVAIRAVVKKLKNNIQHRISNRYFELNAYAGKVELTSLLTNKHKQILDKNVSMPTQYLEWLHEADQYWRQQNLVLMLQLYHMALLTQEARQ